MPDFVLVCGRDEIVVQADIDEPSVQRLERRLTEGDEFARADKLPEDANCRLGPAFDRLAAQHDASEAACVKLMNAVKDADRLHDAYVGQSAAENIRDLIVAIADE